MPSGQINCGFDNGQFVPVNEILLPVDNLAIGRAYAAYEFLKINNGKAFYLDRHLDRFFNSLEILKLKVKFSKHGLESIIDELVIKNTSKNFQVKVFAIPFNLNYSSDYANLYMIPCEIPSFDIGIYKNGTNLLMKEYCRFLPEAKSTNYIASIFWQSEMEEIKAVDVLYYQDNEVLESSRGNIFMVKNGIVFTPERNILKGITRSIVIDIMDKYKIPFSVQPIDKNFLLSAKEVFITSTTKLIMPIIKINENVIGSGIPGLVTGIISKYYNNLLK